MWVVVASLVAVGAHTAQAGRLDVPATYLGLAVMALAGQLLAPKGTGFAVEARRTSR